MIGHWSPCTDRNVTLAFRIRLESPATLEIAAADCYQIFLNGALVGFGPVRAAHGYAREEKYELGTGVLSVLVAGYHCRSFWLIGQQPFVRLRLKTGGKELTEEDFECFRVADRRRRVQRYSYQRAFIEDYAMNTPRSEFLLGKDLYPRELLVPAGKVKLLPAQTRRPEYKKLPAKLIERGGVDIDESLPVWRDRAHTHVGEEIEGYAVSEWEHSNTDDAGKLCYRPDGTGEGRYETYDFGRIKSGFPSLNVRARGNVRLLLVFDELVCPQEGDPMRVMYNRNDVSNCICYELGEGEHSLLSFEPYAMRFLRISVFGDADLSEVGLVLYENPDVSRFKFSVADREAEDVLRAATESFAQNAVDVLTDCPSRERAGWLADSWFTSEAERLFTGGSRVEKCFLENYALSSKEGLPEGMIPMCYPADNYGMFIPNYAMWYILELEKYYARTGDRKLIDDSKENVLGIMKYFSRFENEYGLLENLEGWIFIEWSAAGEPDHVCGVNFPSNMSYFAALRAAAKLYGLSDLMEKAERVRRSVLELAYDGEFFVDNCVRKEGKLVPTGLYTEVCQYSAFWFGLVGREDLPALFDELMSHFGANRQKGYREEISPPNAIFGMYMRLDLMRRYGMAEPLYDECRRYFHPMAELTGTLWECNREAEGGVYNVSCDHGFASYAATWLVYALTGFDGTRFTDRFLGVDCEFFLPEVGVRVVVKNKKRRIVPQNPQ